MSSHAGQLDAADLAADNGAPPWDLIPFDVPCSRCGEDLRGQVEPICPACGLSFDWDEVVPLEHLPCLECDYSLVGLQENRCPECGRRFELADVLAVYHSRKTGLFEYFRYSRLGLFPSLRRTWKAALRPRRLWESISVHTPPRPRALLLFTMFTWMAIVLTGNLLIGVVLLIFRLQLMARVPQFAPGTTWYQLVAGSFARAFTELASYELIGVPILWSVLLFLSLQIFQQSMDRFRVRFGQVLRVWSYAASAVLFWLPPGIGLLLAYEFLDLPPVWLLPLIGIGAWLYVTSVRSLIIGYGTYLGMLRPWLYVLVAQFVAGLAIVTIVTALMVNGVW